MRRFTVLMAILGLALLGACSDDTSSDDDASDTDAVTDVEPDTDGSVDGDADSDDSSDIDPGERREMGESCIRSEQCISGLCIQFDPSLDGFCSRICANSSDCPTSRPGEEETGETPYECLIIPRSSNEFLQACVDVQYCYDPDEDLYGFGPGCQRQGFDCDQTDASINPGAAEQCDNVDRNCNGFLGEAVFFDPPSCTLEDQNGSCRQGRRSCKSNYDDQGREISVEEECVQVIQPGDLLEVCDGIDNDCDGVPDDLDEDIPGVGVVCATSNSACPDGITACDLSLENPDVICKTDGTNPSQGSEPPVCNGIDDNCDGVVDEDFKNEEGIYDQIENCGTCGRNCNSLFPGGPQLYNVVPVCDTSGGFGQCSYECVPGFIDRDKLSENGCEFNPDEDGVYVARPSAGGQNSNDCGSYDKPCATIARGITQAVSAGKSNVRVADGAFPEAVELRNGINILGGHNASNWTRNPDVFVTAITGGASVTNNVAGVIAEDITSPTELSGVTINPPNAPASTNSVGLYVRNASANLRIVNNVIFSAAGGSGVSGENGVNGESGVDGANGKKSINALQNCGPAPNLPGEGGALSCSFVDNSGIQDVSGGRGAAAGCPSYGVSSGDASDGLGIDAGTGGRGAYSFNGRNGDCVSPQAVPGANLDPDAGGRGKPGTDGTGGNGAANGRGSVGAGSWFGIPGQPGVDGLHGAGGGGGGAAAGVAECDYVGSGAPDPSNPANYDCHKVYYIGASGGGGGSGGCAGRSGNGGQAGGGSFAVAIFDNNDDLPVLEDNLISRGRGGEGGNGGPGGSGGQPGDGGAGGAGDTTTGGGNPQSSYTQCMFAGGFGGNGGRGGHGGGGGGGAGGASFDILVSRSSAPAGYLSNNTFNLDASADTGGRGGTGGSSLAGASGRGTAGTSGAAGNLFTLP